jgi:hypothetical protein
MLGRLERADHPVDIIVDLTANQGIPPGLTWGIIEHIHQSGPLAHPQMGTMVLVLSSWLLTAWFRLFTSLVPGVEHKFVQTTSLEEARALLARRRAARDRDL